jgi:O-antigen ligase
VKHLWLLCFPFLFLPNFGFSRQTSFGVLEISDALIVPFIILLILAPSAKYEQRVFRLHPFLWIFLFWALLSTLSIPFRYEYVDDVPVLAGSCLKLSKLVLYVFAGILIARKLSNSKARAEWLWSLLGALFMLALGLLISRRNAGAQATDALEGYKSYNAIIVSVAILCSYITGLWIDNAGSGKWRRCAGLVVVFAVSSVLISASLSTHGRGGWLAFAIGFGYILAKRTQTAKTLAVVVILALASIAAYALLPNLQSLVDLTISPSEGAQLETVDDGARFSTWSHEAPKFLNAPLWGTGFYHRGEKSGLWETGSHNFFLQMFLETGIVGGSLIIAIFILAWWQAGITSVNRRQISVGTRAAIITAVAGGMSGEYYYGNVCVLVLFAIFAIAGSLPATEVVFLTNTERSKIMRWRHAAS